VILMAFDPSMSCTGVAVIRDGERANAPKFDNYRESGTLIQAMTITPDGDTKDYAARLTSLFMQCRALLDEFTPSVVVVELPSTHAPSQARGMQRVGQPIYGAAVGAVISAAACPANLQTCERITPPRVLAYPPDVWTRSLPPLARRTREDKYKTERVKLAAAIYLRSPEEFGAKSNAGDVADAVLLAEYGLREVKRGELESKWRMLA